MKTILSLSSLIKLIFKVKSNASTEDPLYQNAKMKIAKLKVLLPHSTEEQDAISTLETFNVNDRYEDRDT